MATEDYSGDHWAYFGDGNAAQILDSREFIKSELGDRMFKFIFIPSGRIEKTYDIQDEQDDVGAIIREYPASEVVFLERGVYRTRCWIYTDFDGNATPASRRFAHLTETLKDTERLHRSAQAAKNRLFEELNRERKQIRAAIRLQSDMIREVAKARGKIDDDTDDAGADVE